MALDASRSAHYSEMHSVLKQADDQFAANLHVTANSLLLYRITGSYYKREELFFLLDTIQKIKVELGKGEEARAATSELKSLLDEDIDSMSVGTIYSSITDVLDRLRPRELYLLLDELRREPLRSGPRDESDSTLVTP